MKSWNRNHQTPFDRNGFQMGELNEHVQMTLYFASPAWQIHTGGGGDAVARIVKKCRKMWENCGKCNKKCDRKRRFC